MNTEDPPAGRSGRTLRPGPAQSWLELFYDLTFVAAIVVLSTSYSHRSTAENVVLLVMVFTLIWGTWLSTTLMLNRVALVGMWLRSLLLLQMVLILTLAVVADATIEDNSGYAGPVFAAIAVTLVLQYRAATRSDPDLSRYLGSRVIRCLLAAGLFALSPLYDGAWYLILWLVGIALFILPVRRIDHHTVADDHHVIHRFGELTMIMLGEAFVKVGLVATDEPLSELELAALPLTVVVVFVLWWLYFTDIPVAGLPDAHARRTGWFYAHLPLHLCIAALSVGLSRILIPPGSSHVDHSIRYVAIPLLVAVLCLALLSELVGTRLGRKRAQIHLGSGVALLFVWLALFGFDSIDLEGVAVAVTVVLGGSAYLIRRLPAEEVASDLG